MFRSIIALAAVAAFAFAPAASAYEAALRPHTASQSLVPADAGFDKLHTSTGAAGGIDITLPECAADDNIGNRVTRGGLGATFVIAASDQAINVLVFDDTNSLFNLDGTALDAGDEVDLAVGEVGIFTCVIGDKWSAITSGGADGGAS